MWEQNLAAGDCLSDQVTIQMALVTTTVLLSCGELSSLHTNADSVCLPYVYKRTDIFQNNVRTYNFLSMLLINKPSISIK